jgi:predicted transcriptional regulator
MNDFVVKLKNIISVLELTQRELAKELGVHETNISRWINEHHKPLGAFMDKIDTLAEKAKCVISNQEKNNLPYYSVRCELCKLYVETKKARHDEKYNRILCGGCHDTINFK